MRDGIARRRSLGGPGWSAISPPKRRFVHDKSGDPHKWETVGSSPLIDFLGRESGAVEGAPARTLLLVRCRICVYSNRLQRRDLFPDRRPAQPRCGPRHWDNLGAKQEGS